jgi:hypothetical protein
MNGLRDFSSKDKQGDGAGSVPVPDEMPEFFDWAKYGGMEIGEDSAPGELPKILTAGVPRGKSCAQRKRKLLSPSGLVEKPKDTIQLKAIAISCLGVQGKGGDGAGSVLNEHAKVTVQLKCYSHILSRCLRRRR